MTYRGIIRKIEGSSTRHGRGDHSQFLFGPEETGSLVGDANLCKDTGPTRPPPFFLSTSEFGLAGKRGNSPRRCTIKALRKVKHKF